MPIVLRNTQEKFGKFVKSFRLLNRWLRIFELEAIQDSDIDSDVVYFNIIDKHGNNIGYYTIFEK